MHAMMQELNVQEVEQVNGGIFWFVVGAALLLSGCSRGTPAPRDTVESYCKQHPDDTDVCN